jgi:hypothetical protein
VIDDKTQVGFAQFDLVNVPAYGINFFGYQRRLFETTSSPARRDVAASIDANGRRAEIESGSSIALDYHVPEQIQAGRGGSSTRRRCLTIARARLSSLFTGRPASALG